LRSGGDHCDQELAVEGTTAIKSLQLRLQLRSGGGGGAEGGRREAGGTADRKSNNPHLTGGEKHIKPT